MTKAAYIQALSKKDQHLFSILDQIILEKDPSVESRLGSIMSVKEALVYTQEEVFKYGLARNKNYYTFHSMVMYAHPELHSFIKKEGKKLKVQKGCINFSKAEDFPIVLFEEFIERSAKLDFSTVINRYN